MNQLKNVMIQKTIPNLCLWMVTLLFINLATVLIASGSNVAFAQSSEDAAIKKVLKAAPEAFFKRNAEAWQATWKHTPGVSTTRISSLNYVTTNGWDKVSEGALKTIKENPEPIPVIMVQENFIIKVDGKLAIAEFDQTTSNFPDEPETKFRSHQYCILEKENNGWKLVNQISHNAESYKNTDTAIEARLNASGYSLLFAEKIDEAIDVFILNVKLFPQAWNTYDSLGEAYALKGNKELAIKNYERSMDLNPKNDNGKDALVKLKE